MIRSADIHARVHWPTVLTALGISQAAVEIRPGRRRSKNGPCPICHGVDRFFFSNRNGRGDFFCRHCHPKGGDGFELLMEVNGWKFEEARQRVMQVAGLSDRDASRITTPVRLVEAPEVEVIAQPSPRVLKLMREACQVADCDDARGYLEHRRLWPLPAGCSLKAHPSVDYFHDRAHIDRFPALVAEVQDIDGARVTAHLTYLQAERKLTAYEPRKVLSPLTGRIGCAVRLVPVSGGAMGIAEGIETALAAIAMHEVPTWAALNTSLLAKFEPPPGLERLVIFADRDTPGLLAAGRLMERLQGRVRLELRVPPEPHKDFNDYLRSKAE